MKMVHQKPEVEYKKGNGLKLSQYNYNRRDDTSGQNLKANKDQVFVGLVLWRHAASGVLVAFNPHGERRFAHVPEAWWASLVCLPT